MNLRRGVWRLFVVFAVVWYSLGGVALAWLWRTGITEEEEGRVRAQNGHKLCIEALKRREEQIATDPKERWKIDPATGKRYIPLENMPIRAYVDGHGVQMGIPPNRAGCDSRLSDSMRVLENYSTGNRRAVLIMGVIITVLPVLLLAAGKCIGWILAGFKEA